MRRTSRPLRFSPVMLALALGATACMHAPAPKIAGEPAAPRSSSEPWHAPAYTVPAEPAHPAVPTLPAELAPRANALAMSDVVDVALRNNPQTQLSWAQARQGAAQYGAATAAYFPTIDATSNAAFSKTTVGVSNGGVGERKTITPQLSLSYLLLDFGGRSGTRDAARNAAIALDLTHNATLQNVALQAQQAYFLYQAARGLAAAARITVAEADTNAASARGRNKAGVATIADVLQAETLLAQAQLDLETAEGNVHSARAALAVAMGLPANAPFELAALPDTIPVALSAASVDTLINQALANRPDLAAVRAQILQSQAQVRVARAAELPSITLGSTANDVLASDPRFQGQNYGVTVGVSIPLFNLARPYNVQAAQANVDAVTARASLLRTQVAQQVYGSYYTLQTATQRAHTTDALLSSATRNEVAALARYRAGVGTILDLVTAQAALASARAQQAQSRFVWATALAQLAHDVGILGPHGETPIPLSGP